MTVCYISPKNEDNSTPMQYIEAKHILEFMLLYSNKMSKKEYYNIFLKDKLTL